MAVAEIQHEVAQTRRTLLEYVANGEPLIVVKAPPGSGKTYLIRQAAALLRHGGQRVAIAAQTNSQADDICRRLAEEFPQFPVHRFLSPGALVETLGPSVRSTSDGKQLPPGPCIVVATTAKWGLVTINNPYDYVLVDEAWQMAWSDFMLLGQVARRFVLVGDPGQIDPVVTIDISRWATSRRAPHAPAPELLLATADELPLRSLALPASRRLPHDSVAVVRGFYEFPFAAWAEPGSRRLIPRRGSGHEADAAIDLLADGSMAGLTLQTPSEGPPLEDDREIAALAAAVAERLVERGATIRIDDEERPIVPTDIGLCATHRIVNARIKASLPSKLQSQIEVDTPERWQGLERPLMIVVHPVSGVTSPSAFDLETGRLCVMASRHKVGLVVVSRDHLSRTLEETTPSAEQHVGMPDIVGQGHARHVEFWTGLERAGRIARA